MAKKKKKTVYHVGVHVSPKCKHEIAYRSSWELAVCFYLDDDPNVVEYCYETIKLAYILSAKSRRVRFYFPDFLVHYVDGTTILVEVKPENRVMEASVQRKAEAGRIWAAQNKARYEFWTEKKISGLLRVYKEKLLEAKQSAPKVSAPKVKPPVEYTGTATRRANAVKSLVSKARKPRKPKKKGK